MRKNTQKLQPKQYFFQKHYYKFLLCLMVFGIIMGVASYFVLPVAAIGIASLLVTKIMFSISVSLGLPSFIYRVALLFFEDNLKTGIGSRHVVMKLFGRTITTNQLAYVAQVFVLALLFACLVTMACLVVWPELPLIILLHQVSSYVGLEVLVGVLFVTSAQLLVQGAMKFMVLPGLAKLFGSKNNDHSQPRSGHSFPSGLTEEEASPGAHIGLYQAARSHPFGNAVIGSEDNTCLGSDGGPSARMFRAAAEPAVCPARGTFGSSLAVLGT